MKVDHLFSRKLKNFGVSDLTLCYSCGNCTAVCPLSDGESAFPRRFIRYSLLGMKEKILGSPDLWLCYGCGECTDSCPRNADPAGLMMALRRYVTAKYSPLNIASLFYRKTTALFTWLVLTLFATIGLLHVSNPEPNMNKVDYLSFISLDFLHDAGIALFAFIGVASLLGLISMYLHLKRNGHKGLSAPGLIGGFFRTLLREVLLERKFATCEDNSRYMAHLSLFWGFSGLFLASFLAFIRDIYSVNISFALSHGLGVISGILFLYGTLYFLYRRLRGDGPLFRNSHHTDWMFLALLILTGLSGFAMTVFKILNMPTPAYASFLIHLVLVFDLLVALPFTKFAHFVYRPFALWLTETAKNGSSST